MVLVEVRKIIVESRAKGIPAEEIKKVTGVSLSAINNIVSNYLIPQSSHLKNIQF